MKPFAHLRLHTAYSMLEGALRLKDLPKLCQAKMIPALAITDTANLFGAMEFSETLAANGIQPIIGCAMPIITDEQTTHPTHTPREKYPTLALLAKNEDGYENLLQLSTLSYEKNPSNPALNLSQIQNHAQNLLCLTGGQNGILNAQLLAGQPDKAETILAQLQNIFGDNLYIEIQRHGNENKDHETWLLNTAAKINAPIIATNEPYFAAREDYEAHDALLCIADGTRVADENRRRLTPEHYFKSGDEMHALFADLPDAIANALDAAKRCAFRPVARDPRPPRFLKGGPKDEAEALRDLAKKGCETRLKAAKTLPAPEETYWQRLEFELNIITKMEFSGYFLIVADFVQWARREGIPVGPGRGSGAGSLVAWALTITDLDPIRFNLVFERFLNPERVSMPDFDIDFCQEARDRVIQYVREKYGEKHVAHIITFGTLQARAVLRDVGRVLGLPYGQVDRLCKFIPNDPAHPVSLAEAIEKEPELQQERDDHEEVARLFRIGSALEGLYRHASTHAAGIVIGARPLDQDVPLCRDPRSGDVITQFSMKWAEKAGLVKFDLLGLKTLTMLQRAQDLLKNEGITLAIEDIPLNDPPSYELIARGETTGIFQLESAGMRDALRQAKPDRFEDIIALVSLYRPGPMDNIPQYVRRKNGAETPDYLHPLLKPVLEETFGVVIYQEQVMRMAQLLSGYSLGEADILRRAMGKKIKSEMASQKQRFVEGAVARDVPYAKASELFTLAARFAGYGFNKSHAAAYALLAYQSAYLKAHHPTQFLAALMTMDIGNPDKLGALRQEAQRLGVETRPPDVNRSGARFIVEEGKILYALGAIRNVGLGAAEHIVKERARDGDYRDIFNFARRLSGGALPKRAFESLALVGALDSLHPNRRQIVEASDKLMDAAAQETAALAIGQEALFQKEARQQPDPVERQILGNLSDWTRMERLEKEFQTAGLYLSGHPLEDWREPMADMSSIQSYRELRESGRDYGRLAGVVIAARKKHSRRGNVYALLDLSDMGGTYQAILFSDLWEQAKSFLEPGRLIIMDARMDERPGSGAMRIKAEKIAPLEKMLARRAKPVSSADAAPKSPANGKSENHPNHASRARWRVFLESREGLPLLKKSLTRGAENRPAEGRVTLVIATEKNGQEAEILLPGFFALNSELRERVRAVPGVRKVEVQESKTL